MSAQKTPENDSIIPTMSDFTGNSTITLISDFDCIVEVRNTERRFPKIKLIEGEEVKIKIIPGKYIIYTQTEDIDVLKEYPIDAKNDETEVVFIEIYKEYQNKRIQLEGRDDIDKQVLTKAKYKILVRQGDEFFRLGDKKSAIEKYNEAKTLGLSTAELDRKIVAAGGTVSLNYGYLTDNTDGKKYKTVQIGTQIWMAENLAFNSTGSYHYPDKSKIDYGNLYTWDAAMNACPEGWKLPSDDDFAELFAYVGTDGGTKLKADFAWKKAKKENVTGLNTWGFNALPAGWCDSYDGSFSDLTKFTGFWTSTESNSKQAWYWSFHYESSGIGRDSESKTLGLSIRCIKK